MQKWQYCPDIQTNNNLVITSNTIWQPSLKMYIPMKPAGYVLSVLTLPSTRTWRCIKMAITSLYVRAYFSLFRRMRIKGRHSLDLWGPDDGFGAYTARQNEFKRKLQIKMTNNIINNCEYCTYKGPTKLVKHPVFWSIEPLQVFLQPSRLKYRRKTTN